MQPNKDVKQHNSEQVEAEIQPKAEIMPNAQHLTNIKLNKKKTFAKDDTCQELDTRKQAETISQQKLSNNTQNNQKAEDIQFKKTLQNLLTIEQDNQKQNSTDKKLKLKRKMSEADFLQRNQKNEILSEKEDTDFDLAQSLLTLQLNRTAKLTQINKIQQIQQMKFLKLQQNIQKAAFPQSIERTKENSTIKMSNHALKSIEDERLEPNDHKQKDIDSDEESETDSEQKSVDLDDPELQKIKQQIFYFNWSIEVLNLKIQEAIKIAEGNVQLEIQNNQQPEEQEYESLVWGQSIWSTDIPKESK